MTEPTAPAETDEPAYRAFVETAGRTLRRALVARFGAEVGGEASADALAVAWQQWPRVRAMASPIGFLYRVGQSKARPNVRWRRRTAAFPGAGVADGHHSGPSADVLDLFAALRRLSADERTALVMVKSYGYSHREVAEVLGVTASVVNNLVHRGLLRVRSLMEVCE